MTTDDEITAAIDSLREQLSRIDTDAPQTPADQTFARLAQVYRNAPDADLIWYAAVQLKASPESLFAGAAEQASPTARDYLIQFAGRRASDKTLKSMGSEAVEEGGRIRFRPLPPPWRRAKRT